MSKPSRETPLAIPEEITGLHAGVLATVGEIGQALYSHLAGQWGVLRPLPNVTLHDRPNSTSHTWQVKKVEDQRVAGYRDVWPLMARIETWREGKYLRRLVGQEVELVLYAPLRDGSEEAPSDETLRRRSDTIGISNLGAAFVNSEQVVPSANAPRGAYRETPPVGLREIIHADRRVLQVAGAAIMGAESGWPGVALSIRGGGMRMLEEQFVTLGNVSQVTAGAGG
jgi:hypothetical protein